MSAELSAVNEMACMPDEPARSAANGMSELSIGNGHLSHHQLKRARHIGNMHGTDNDSHRLTGFLMALSKFHSTWSAAQNARAKLSY